MGRVLVAGGTGFIGSAIVRELLTHEAYNISVLSRNPEKARSIYGGRVQMVKGDITVPGSLEPALDQIDAVIQCVQFPNHPVQNPRKGFTYEKVDAEGTENLCRAVKNSSVKKIIYLSGAGTAPGKTEPWFRAKLRAEKAVQKTGRDFVILRPSWVYGPGDRSMTKFISFARHLPFMPVIGDGENRVTPLFIDDLAVFCVRALDSQEALNQIIEVGGPQTLTMNEIQSAVLKAMNRKKPLLHQSLWLMKIVSTVMNLILSKPPLSAEAVDFVTADVPVDTERAEKIFGFKTTPLSEGLKKMLQ
jgi:nucleoside-diphosphate-sugar epimerase